MLGEGSTYSVRGLLPRKVSFQGPGLHTQAQASGRSVLSHRPGLPLMPSQDYRATRRLSHALIRPEPNEV